MGKWKSRRTCKLLYYKGLYEFNNGSVYDGEKLNSLIHGRGRFYYSDGGMYDGEWK